MGSSVKRPVRILIADHHRIVQAGFREVLKQARSAQGFATAVAETAEEALELLRMQKFDVLFVVYDLPPQGGIKTTELILRRNPHLKILGLMTTAEKGPVAKMLAAGAIGCILTNIQPDTLIEAIRTVLNGRRYFSNDIALELNRPDIDHERSSSPRITPREQEVLDKILHGYRNHEIADSMGISKRTVAKHRQNLNAKLGARNAVELALSAMRFGLAR
jgi:DNA-binding NarL/FixJ family response regulator